MDQKEILCRRLSAAIREAFKDPETEKRYQEWKRNRAEENQCAPTAANDKARTSARRQAHVTT